MIPVKVHTIIWSVIATTALLAIIGLAFFAATSGTPPREQNAATIPNTETHNNQIHFTANPAASQGNSENTEGTASRFTGNDVSSNASDKKRAQEQSYVVKTLNGKIAVFADGASAPVKTLDVEVATLPQQDQEALQAGISVNGSEALRRTLEDYES